MEHFFVKTTCIYKKAWPSLICATIFALPAVGETFPLDASGVAGTSGWPGRDGNTSYFSGFFGRGYDGEPGGAGGPGSDGVDGGTIDLQLLSARTANNEVQTGAFRLRGRLQRPRGAVENLDQIISSDVGIRLSAMGGDGGRGGDGGHGGDGSNGAPGSDGNRNHGGSTGGRGGNGGDGGEGGREGDAGRGGAVRVSTLAQDSHWLMLLDGFDVSAGRAGEGGRSGDPGRGGWGGPGGAGYSWDEVRTTEKEGQTTTETIEHSTPEASSGWNGSAGSLARNGSRGRDSRTGDFSISVLYEDGSQRTYTERYDIKIQTYRLEDENKDGIFEPGEKVFVRDLRIRNSGGMPTPPPPNSFVQISLSGSDRLETNTQTLDLPKSLAPEETFQFAQVLTFIVRETDATEVPKLGEPFRVSQTLSPRAVLSTVDREFSNAQNPVSFSVQFPVAIRPVKAIAALAPGEHTDIYFEITNLSQRDLGSAAELQRGLSVLLQGGSEVSGEEFRLSYADEDRVTKPLAEPQRPLLKAIDHPRAGQSKIIKGTIFAPASAEAQSAYYVGAELSLGKSGGANLQPIQQRAHRITIVSAYERDPNAEVLLITNGSSTKEELQAWKSMLNWMGLPSATWNLSYYGFLDLAEKAKSSGLLEDFRGKTIVFLNYRFESDLNKEMLPRLHLAKEALLKAAGESRVNFLFLGDDTDSRGGKLIESLLVPTQTEREVPYRGLKDFTSRFVSEIGGPDTYGKNGPNRPMFSSATHKIAITGSYYFSRPKEADLSTLAEKLQRDFLDRGFPNRRFIVTYDFAPTLLARGGHFSRDHFRIGDLIVRQMPDQPENVAMSVRVPENEMHGAGAIWAHENVAAIYASLTFPKKLRAFDIVLAELSSDDGETIARGKILVDAMLADISFEQRAALEGWFRYETKNRTRDLELLANFEFSNCVRSTKSVEQERLIARLIAGINLMADHSYIWFWSNLTVVPVTNGRSTMIWNYTFADKFTANILGGAAISPSLKAAIDSRYNDMQFEAYARARSHHTSRNHEIQLDLEAPLRRDLGWGEYVP